MYVDQFKTEFASTKRGKIMGRGRLSVTLNQLIFALVFAFIFNLILRPLPLSYWMNLGGIALGAVFGIWLGSDQAGALRLMRFLMPLVVTLRRVIGKPHTVDISAEWNSFSYEEL